ncbi:MAG TPA: EboA domain-containing protein [Chryseosolibacter sp.]|nr:EboA domain-containing protein [Chryseosolibacter sp.]
MFAYDFDRLNNLFREILTRGVSTETMKWLEDQGLQAKKPDISKFNVAFVAMPRRTGKEAISITARDAAAVDTARPGLNISGWTHDRLSRVWLLMQLKADDRQRYVSAIENLFLSAEMSELVALYSALPVLAYPDAWVKRCAEGIRSNIGQVLEAVICNNPYAAEHLDEAAWNQLVLKAIFTEKPVLEIVGLRKRANRALANSLLDYAHERWAAHRDLNPLLWVCVGPFIDENNFADIQRVFSSADPLERDAAALAAYESPYGPAQQMVKEYSGLVKDIEAGKVSWQRIAATMKGVKLEQ